MWGKNSAAILGAVVICGMTSIPTAAQSVQLPGAQRPLTDAEVGYLVIFAGVLAVYVIPTLIAFSRRHPNRWPIALINIFLGGTGIGWFGALIWALSAIHRSATGNHGGESGLNLFINDPPAAPADPVDQIARLKTLLDTGAISDVEYRKIKSSILER